MIDSLKLLLQWLHILDDSDFNKNDSVNIFDYTKLTILQKQTIATYNNTFIWDLTDTQYIRIPKQQNIYVLYKRFFHSNSKQNDQEIDTNSLGQIWTYENDSIEDMKETLIMLLHSNHS